MPSSRRYAAKPISIPPGVALVPEDFREKLEVIKKLTGLSWERMASAMGVDSRQTVALAQAGRRARRGRHAGPGAPRPAGARRTGRTHRRGRDRNL